MPSPCQGVPRVEAGGFVASTVGVDRAAVNDGYPPAVDSAVDILGTRGNVAVEGEWIALCAVHRSPDMTSPRCWADRYPPPVEEKT